MLGEAFKHWKTTSCWAILPAAVLLELRHDTLKILSKSLLCPSAVLKSGQVSARNSLDLSWGPTPCSEPQTFLAAAIIIKVSQMDQKILCALVKIWLGKENFQKCSLWSCLLFCRLYSICALDIKPSSVNPRAHLPDGRSHWSHHVRICWNAGKCAQAPATLLTPLQASTCMYRTLYYKLFGDKIKFDQHRDVFQLPTHPGSSSFLANLVFLSSSLSLSRFPSRSPVAIEAARAQQIVSNLLWKQFPDPNKWHEVSVGKIWSSEALKLITTTVTQW